MRDRRLDVADLLFFHPAGDRRHQPGGVAARVIRREIRDETALTASAGVAPNKFLAKIASDWKKPDGLFVIRPQEVEAFLSPLPVGKLPGVGKTTGAALAALGIATVGDLKSRPLVELEMRFGRFGRRLHELSRGVDEHPVVAHRPVKSISSETTFENDLPLAALTVTVERLARQVWEAARRRERLGRTITVKLKTADFRALSRRFTPAAPPADAQELAGFAVAMLDQFGQGEATRFRLAGVGVSNFLDEAAETPQAELFPDPE